MNIHHQSNLIETVLTPNLLSPKWRKLVKPLDHVTTGHCYIAAEALWHMQGKDKRKWQPMVASYTDCGVKCTHWWLVNKETGERADPTRKQYLSQLLCPPYELGRKVGFLTKKPSKRAATIIKRIKNIYY